MVCMNHKPRIAVTRSESRDYITYYAIRLILTLLGAKTILITTRNKHLSEELDGLIIGGGVDITPSYYQAKPKPNYPYELERDKLEFDWLKKAESANIPVLGICRGSQIINIHRGGTLHLDISKAYEKAQYPTSLIAKIAYRKRMYPIKDSLIYNIVKDKKVKVNSIHTQGINEVGKNLIITAQEKNKVVQVIEDPSRLFYMGVQFHPELMTYHKYHRGIFKAFLKSAIQNRKNN